MKHKSKTLKYPTESALRNHELEHVLPSFITRSAFEVPPLPKTADFYMSSEFIWNNPYRSSKKTYRYYHQTNKDNEPRLEEMRKREMTDRQDSEQHRIQCVRELRSLEIDRLRARKLRRRLLEDRCKGRASQQHTHSKEPASNQPESQKEEMDRQIFDLIKSETLKKREIDCSRLKKRHQQNMELMLKSGMRTGWNWTTMRFHSSER